MRHGCIGADDFGGKYLAKNNFTLKISVVHEPARAGSAHGTPGLEARASKKPPRNRQEARVAKGLESARRPLFEPPRDGCQETRVGSAHAQHYSKSGEGGSPPANHFCPILGWRAVEALLNWVCGLKYLGMPADT